MTLKESPCEQSVYGDPLSAGQEDIYLEVKARKVAQGVAWQRSVGNFQWQLARHFEQGIFHGIDAYDHRKTRATTGFPRLVYNRVGVGQ